MEFAIEKNIGSRSYMEDRGFIYTSPNYTYIVLGVFDGHGGYAVSEYICNFMYNFISDNFRINQFIDDSKIPAFLRKLFDETDSAVQRNTFKLGALGTGSTAQVVFINLYDRKIHTANTGDSRSFILDGKPSFLSKDHKPQFQSEKERIESLGGGIYRREGDVWRIKNSGLAVSRSFGDLNSRPYITYKPEIRTRKIYGNKFEIVSATDGIWDVIDKKTSIQLIKERNSFIDYSTQHGSHDNKLVIYFKCNC